jgi:hypothetical protein
LYCSTYCLEACVAGDEVIGQQAAVTPATHAESRRVGQPRGDGVVDSREEIGHLLVAPIREYAARELAAAAGAAAIINREHDVAMGCEQLPLERRPVAFELE